MSTPTDSSPESTSLISVVRQHLHAILITDYQFQLDANFIRACRDSTPDLQLELRADGAALTTTLRRNSTCFATRLIRAITV